MKFLFIVQGEGNGHLTQAIALKKILSKHGHKVVAILIGKNKQKEIPAFFKKCIHIPIYYFESPNFLSLSKKHIKYNISISILYNLSKLPNYLKSILFIRKKIITLQVDIVVNFFEILTGLTYGIFHIKTPYVSIAHQYLLFHPSYKFPPKNKIKLKMLLLFTKFTCIKSYLLFALSFEKKKNIPEKRLIIVPPLLRKEVFEDSPTKNNYILGYLLNNTIPKEIITYQKKYPDTFLYFFWNKKNASSKTIINDHLILHTLDDNLFIQYMKGCKGYITTSGFESICEAMYLGKPTLMIPVHIEQLCNAYEATIAGAGIKSKNFDVEKLISFIPSYKRNLSFHHWALQSEKYWMKEINILITIFGKQPKIDSFI